MIDASQPPAIFLMGPTATGKTAAAVQLAKQFKGEIISVDSVLVYQGMDIGSAKPTLEERAGIPHHLIDILDPAASFSSNSFREAALPLMEAISNRGKIPILVGGTFLYFNALLKGLAHLPQANPAIRKKLDAELAIIGSPALHQRLKTIDPESAHRIHPNDRQRIQRAIEVYAISGKPMSQLFRETPPKQIPYRQLKCIITTTDRKQLHEKIANRFKQMLADGLIDEVNALYSRGDLSVDLPAIRAVGYRQVWTYLAGEYDLDTLLEKGIIATRQLAKRQFTWLQQETDCIQFDAFEAGLHGNMIERLKPLL